MLNGVSMEVDQGEFVAIMGPSGCGKSILLNILGLLDNPSAGEYLLLDKAVGSLKGKDRTQYRKGNIGFVFQSFNLIDELNVFENVELPLIYLQIKASERKKMVIDILRRMNISLRAGHFPQRLSGGQQQRVAIARAVVANPKLILADEPTGNIDSKNGADDSAHRSRQGGYHGDHGHPLPTRRRLRPPQGGPVRRKNRHGRKSVFIVTGS